MDFELVLSDNDSNGPDSPPSTSSEGSSLDEYERISALSQDELTLMGDLENVKVSPNLLEDAKDACRKRIMAILEFSKGGPLGGDEDCGIHVLDGNQLRQIDEWRNPNFPSENTTSEAPNESVSSEQDCEKAATAELSPAEADQEEPAPAPSNICPETSTSKAPAEPASAEQAPDETTQEEPVPAPAYGPNTVLKKEIPEWIKKHEVHEEDFRSHQYIKQTRVDRGYEKLEDQGKSHSDEGRIPVQEKKEDRNDDKKEEAEMMNEKKVDQEPGTSGTPQRNRKKADRNKNKKKKDQEGGTPGSTQKKKPRKEAVLLMAMDFGPKAGGSLGDIRRRMGTERTENAKKVARRSCH